MLLLRLSKYLLVSILIDWIELPSLYSLLGSTSGTPRKQLLNLLRSFPLQWYRSMISSNSFIPVTPRVLQWFHILELDPPTNITLEWSSIYQIVPTSIPNLVEFLVNAPQSFMSKQLLYNWLKSVKRIRIDNMNDQVLKRCCNVERLEIMSNFNYGSVVLKNCGPLIQVLDLTGLLLHNETVLIQMCTRCSHLRALKIQCHPLFLKVLYDVLLVQCRQLVVFDLNHSTNMCVLRSPSTRSIQRNVLMSRCQFHNMHATHQTLQTLIKIRESELTSLSVNYWFSTESGALEYDLTNCSSLTHLELKSYRPTFWFSETLNLKYLSYDSHISCNVNLLQCCAKSLLVLKLRNAECSDFSRMPQLHTLQLACCNLTSLTLTSCVVCCPALTSLDVNGNVKLRNDIGDILEQYPQLTALNLNGCHLLTNTLLQRLSNSLIRLRDLRVANWKHVTDIGLMSVLYRCRITCLDILNCKLLTGITLRYIGRRGHIKHLSLDIKSFDSKDFNKIMKYPYPWFGKFDALGYEDIRDRFQFSNEQSEVHYD